MKRMIEKLIKTFLKACSICHGMGHQELPNGDTRECIFCKGKGMI